MSSKLKATLIVLGALIGILVTSQFQTPVLLNSTFPLDQLEAQKELLKTFSDEQAVLQNKIVMLRQQIEEVNKSKGFSQKEGLITKLDDLKKKVGLAQLKSSGLEIYLSDGVLGNRENTEGLSSSLVHAADLRDIVNVLRAGHAEGISVNNQRILATTPIVSVGNSILINNFNVAPPYSIKVAGDPEILLQRLKDDTVLPDLKERITRGDIEMEITPKDHITLPIYNGSFRTKHIEGQI